MVSAAGARLPVHRATLEDVGILTETLALAFHGYPWTDFTIGPDQGGARLRRSFSHYLVLTIRFLGEVWMTADGASVAVWLKPEPPDLPAEVNEATERLESETPAERRTALAGIGERLGPLRPDGPHWTLASMGTAPSARGRGMAGAVLAPMLRRLDDTGVPAVLETSSARNVRFYRRFGFEVAGAVAAEGEVPGVWLMTRQSGSAA